MPSSNQDFHNILFAVCEISYYVIGIPMQRTNAVTIAEALLNRVVYQFVPPKIHILVKDATLSADVLMHIYNTLNIRSQIMSTYNHGSPWPESYIGSISEMLCNTLRQQVKIGIISRSMLLCIKYICIPSTGYSTF